MAIAIREPVLEAATTDDFRNRVATDGGEIVVAGDEGEVLETNDVCKESDDFACSTHPGDYPCAACYISGSKAWPDKEGDGDDRHGSQ